MSNGSTGTAELAQVRASARAHAPDRYYAALFAPSEARADLIALAAFAGEIERIARQVSEPALGEIRLAWWRDALVKSAESQLTGNPVLDAFADTVRRRALSLRHIEDYLDAHAEALYADPPASDADLVARVQRIDGIPFLFAAAILGFEMDAAILDGAARASGFARLGVELPYALMRGRAPLPIARAPNPYEEGAAADWRPQISWLVAEGRRGLLDVRRHLAGKPRVFTTSLLPLALLEPYFRALQDPGHEPARDIIEIAPIARLWRIARAHWSGRL